MTTFRSNFLSCALIAVASGAMAFAMSATNVQASSDVAIAPQSPAPAVAAAPVTPERLALAKAYINSVPVEDQVKAAIEDMISRVSADQRVLVRSIAEKTIDYTRLRDAAAQTVAEIFTDAEIKKMTEFFASPEGKSVSAKLPIYEQRMQPVMTDMLRDFVLKLQENKVNLQAAQ